MKRSDYITWDQYFMGIAIMSANRSKDPNTQVGACIVDQDNRILTVGYNGMPSGCNDDAVGPGRRRNGEQIFLCLPCGVKCDFELPWWRYIARFTLLCNVVPMQ